MNVKDFAFAVDPIYELRNRTRRIREENLVAPSQTISGEGDIDRALKASFDFCWNTCGFLGSANFESDGKWRRR